MSMSHQFVPTTIQETDEKGRKLWSGTIKMPDIDVEVLEEGDVQVPKCQGKSNGPKGFPRSAKQGRRNPMEPTNNANTGNSPVSLVDTARGNANSSPRTPVRSTCHAAPWPPRACPACLGFMCVGALVLAATGLQFSAQKHGLRWSLAVGPTCRVSVRDCAVVLSVGVVTLVIARWVAGASLPRSSLSLPFPLPSFACRNQDREGPKFSSTPINCYRLSSH